MSHLGHRGSSRGMERSRMTGRHDLKTGPRHITVRIHNPTSHMTSFSWLRKAVTACLSLHQDAPAESAFAILLSLRSLGRGRSVPCAHVRSFSMRLWRPKPLEYVAVQHKRSCSRNYRAPFHQKHLQYGADSIATYCIMSKR